MEKKQNLLSAAIKGINFKKSTSSKRHLGVIIEKESLTFVIPDSGKDKNKAVNQLKKFKYPEGLSYLSENFGKFVFDCLKKIPKELSSEAWIILPYDEVETRYVKIPKTSEKASENAVYWTLKKEIEFDIKNYFLDFEKTEAITERGINKEGVCAYIAEKSVIHSITHFFEDAGCKIIGITSVPFAVQTVLKNTTLNIGPQNICFVNPKKDSLEIYIYTKNTLKLVRQTKTGITSLAEALMMNAVENDDEEFKWSNSEELTKVILEHIKETKENNKIDQGIEPAVERIARQVERTVNYFKNQIQSESIDAVIVNGILSDYHPLTDIIYEYTGINVFPSIDIINENLIETHDEKIFKDNDFIAGLGSIYCSNKYSPNILFTHRHEKASRIIDFLNKTVFAVGISALIICTLLFFMQKKEIKNLTEKKQKAEKQLSSYSPELSSSALSETAAQITANKEKLKKKAKILEPGVLLNQFAKSSSKNIKIKDFKLELNDKKREISFSGYVFGKEYTLDSRLADYILNLSSSEMFLNVSVKAQERLKIKDETIIYFSAVIEI
jgi:Tfp pilus assembly PilM family ATPase/uncharacterized membrane protein YciS (DUF1049 family)